MAIAALRSYREDIKALALLPLVTALFASGTSTPTPASDLAPIVVELPDRPKEPALPNLGAIRYQLAAEQPPPTTAFTYAIDLVAKDPIFHANYLNDLEDLLGTPKRAIPGLHLRTGIVDLPTLGRAVADPDILACEDWVCTLRTPLIVNLGAGLLVRGTLARPFVLRLSHQGAAFLGSSGLLWIEHAEVTSWDETDGTERTGPEPFRGFILGTEGSRTVVRDAWLHDLGYDGGMAYGLSFGVGDRTGATADLANPTGSVFRSRLDRLFYAFYSFQAHDVRLVDNLIADSWKYGLDPHDDSLRTLIAGNHVRGTRMFDIPGKSPGGHGIIVSRRVTDGWILENESHDNAKSGFVVDKQSDRMAVIGNHASGNGDDGLTVYESSELWIEGNHFTDNGDSAIRIRGSRASVLIDNKMGAHPGYCLKTTSKTNLSRPTSLYVGGNQCGSGTRLLRIENMRQLDLEAEAFGDQRSLAKRRVNGPKPWRDAVVDQLRNGGAARLQQAAKHPSQPTAVSR